MSRLLAFIVSIFVFTAAAVHAQSPSFAEFDRRAQAGERLNVVFFGASLTWGANASNPLLTSYRARVAEKMEARYPAAHLKFWDGAIGGTGSQLGVFRLNRDVLSRQPDLVFLDFSANDDIYSDNPESLASYEAILRRILTEAKCPVVQVIFPFRWNVANADLAKMKRRDAHLAISAAYHTGLGDAIALAVDRVKAGTTTLDTVWPLDGVHPCDEGYRLFADAAWSAFESSVQEKRVCSVPAQMLNAGTYLQSARVPMSTLGPLPAGWKSGLPSVTSAYFDFLMSRWLDSVAIASRVPVKGGDHEPPAPARFQATIRGSMVLLFGEATKISGKYRVYLDGEQVHYAPPNSKTPPLEIFDPGTFSQKIGGNGHHVQVISTGLDPTKDHLLEIEPILDIGQELRLESICVAGEGASVRAVTEQK
jgi:lysophospholipase L1-like esterase